MEFDALPRFIFFWTINKLLRIFFQLKQMKVTIAVFHLSRRSLNMHLHASSGKLPSDPCSTFQWPIRSVRFRGAKMLSRTRAAWPKTWSARTFFGLLFIFHTYEWCMAKLTCVRY